MLMIIRWLFILLLKILAIFFFTNTKDIQIRTYLVNQTILRTVTVRPRSIRELIKPVQNAVNK